MNSPLPNKIWVGLLSVALFLMVSFSFFAGKIFAASVDPIPPPGRIPCSADQTEDPNFNSSRPYQASPCGDSSKAIMCGNSLQVIESFPAGTAPVGTPFVEKRIEAPAKTYAADLANAQFPIAGNTELIKNSQNTNSNLDDATRMNEYLSAYLNGTTNQAEYGQTDISKVVDFAGPIKKLLPSMIQDSQRIATIKSTTKQITFIDDTQTTTGSTTAEARVTQPSNHDQIVVCAQKKIPLIPPFLTNFFGIGSVGILNDVPVECYPNKGSKAQGDVFRLTGGGFNWSGSDSAQDILNWAAQNLAKYFPKNTVAQVISGAATRWPLKIPPLPWSDQNGKPFPDDISYQKAYNEWRGQLCAIVPNPLSINEKTLVCVNAWPLISNPYADLYQYVPLSVTADKSAKNMITGVGIKGESGTVIEISQVKAYEVEQEPILYFPHTEESSDLLDSLNKIYVPKTGTSNDISTNTTEPTNDPVTGQCRILDLRTNPGDNLFPEVKPSEVRVHVEPYTLTREPCHDTTRHIVRHTPGGETDIETPIAVCEGSVSIEIRMVTKVPFADEIFASSTAGADSDFRKIYPKVGPNAPVTCIANIPSATSVQYIPKENMDGLKVIGPLGNNTTDNPQLFFPHFGSVYDYFLKGIQTALRPQGYADPTPESGKFCSPAVPTQCNQSVPDSAIPSKYLGAFKTNFINQANIWTTGSGCEGPQFNLATQCYNFVVSESQKAKINPAFTLTIWLNESDASNYCFGGQSTQDFGIGGQPSLWQNFTGQLTTFLRQPAAFKSCASTPGWIEPMEAFLSRFRSSAGTCTPSDPAGIKYYNDIRTYTWPLVTGNNCIKNGKFAITWPDDMSCP